MTRRWRPTTRRIAAMALALGTVLAASAAAAMTPSITSLSFLFDVRVTNTALVDSDALAEMQADRAAVRAFARRAAEGRAAVVADLVEWAREQQRQKEAAAAAPAIDTLSRMFGDGDDQIVIDAVPRPPDMSRLAAVRGAAFDDLYVAAQIRALDRLVTVYKEFILDGDDETLRALAVHDLPRVERLLAEVRRLR